MTNLSVVSVISLTEIPVDPNSKFIYRFTPRNEYEAYYRERTDRNIGWITREEQEILRRSVVGVSGCGGMGGQVAEKLARLGVGEIRIADIEAFDVTNINRQLAATRSSVGKSKAFETARMIRGITDDFTLAVYPQGICEEVVDHFLTGCDIVCDEIEFWSVGARILLHERARALGVHIMNCNTIGFGTRLFYFTPESGTMEECLRMTYEEARSLEEKIRDRTATSVDRARVMEAVITGLLPELPDYEGFPTGNPEKVRERLLESGRGAIIATNPPLATGFLVDHVLLHLLRNSGVKREVVRPPKMPGYLYFDAAKMEAKIVKERWW